MNARRSPLIPRQTRRPLLRTVATTGVLALGALPLTACGSDSAADGGKVSVVASFYPMEFLAQEIGGEHVSVTGLTEPGVEPHDLELAPKQVGVLGEADLVVYLKGLQPAVDKAVEQSGAEHVAEATSLTTLEKHGTDVQGEEGHEEEGHAEEGHAGHEEEGHADEGHAEPEQEGHEGHDHGTEAGDPHIWLDPVRYAEVAEGVGKRLAKADPEHAADYKKNTARLVQRLKTLNTDFEKGLESRRSDTFLTTHAAFGYLADRYGLHEEAIAGVDPEAGSISGAHMKKLHRIAREDDVSTVFFENDASDDTAQTLARDLNLKTGVLNPVETVKDPEKQDYFTVMRQNLDALRTALDAK